MTMIIDGTNGLTFNNSTVQASAGQVLQVVNFGTVSGTNTTSASAVTTNVTASITPKFASSKILITVFANGIQKSAGNNLNGVILWLYKNGSNLQRFGEYIGYTNTSVINNIGTAAIEYLDSPATTSAITYTVYIASNVSGQQASICGGADYSTITLMEIAG